MIDVCKKIIYMALAGLVFVGLTGICLAEPNQTNNADGSRERMNPEKGYGMMPNQNAGLPMGVPVDVVYSGHGFALQGNESHILRLKVEDILPLEPGQIRVSWPPIRAWRRSGMIFRQKRAKRRTEAV